MTVPTLRLAPESIITIEADVLVVGVHKTEDGPRLATDVPEILALEPSLALIGVSGAVDEFRRLPLAGIAASSLAVIGLGSGEI